MEIDITKQLLKQQNMQAPKTSACAFTYSPDSQSYNLNSQKEETSFPQQSQAPQPAQEQTPQQTPQSVPNMSSLLSMLQGGGTSGANGGTGDLSKLVQSLSKNSGGSNPIQSLLPMIMGKGMGGAGGNNMLSSLMPLLQNSSSGNLLSGLMSPPVKSNTKAKIETKKIDTSAYTKAPTE